MSDKISKKPLINFNDWWPILKAEADRKGLKKVAWMDKSGLNYQRYSEFEKCKRDVSPRYFLKLIGGLGMDWTTLEKKTGKRFSSEQIKALRFEALIEANRGWLEAMLLDPDALSICKSFIESKIQK